MAPRNAVAKSEMLAMSPRKCTDTRLIAGPPAVARLVTGLPLGGMLGPSIGSKQRSEGDRRGEGAWTFFVASLATTARFDTRSESVENRAHLIEVASDSEWCMLDSSTAPRPAQLHGLDVCARDSSIDVMPPRHWTTQQQPTSETARYDVRGWRLGEEVGKSL